MDESGLLSDAAGDEPGQRSFRQAIQRLPKPLAQALRRRDHVALASAIAALPVEQRRSPEVAIAAALGGFMADDLPAARAALTDAAAAGGDPLAIADLRRRLALRAEDRPGHIAALEQLVGLRPDHAPFHLQLIDALLATAATPAARRAHDRALRVLGPLPDLLHADGVIAMRAGDAAAFASSLDRAFAAIADGPDAARFILLFRRFSRNLANTELAPLAARMKQAWPRAAARPQGQTASYDRLMARHLRGDLPDPAAAIAQIGGGAFMGLRGAEIARLFAAMPQRDQWQRGALPMPRAEITISPPGPSGTVVFAFSCLAGRAMGPVEALDACCAAAGHGLVFIRDAARQVGLGGLKSLGADVAASAAGLDAIAAAMGAHRRVTLGFSAGGAAALIYGAQMQADKAVALSPPTCGTVDFMGSINDQRAAVLIRRIAAFQSTEIDLRERLANVSLPEGIAVHYPAGNERDRLHATHLAALPGVTLKPLEDSAEHAVLGQMILRGDTDALW